MFISLFFICPFPENHFEIVCQEQEHANQLQEIINSFEMDAKIVRRKKSYVVYLKEGAQIVDILNIMEAHGKAISFRLSGRLSKPFMDFM